MKNFIRNPHRFLPAVLSIFVALSGVRFFDVVIFPQLPKNDVKQEPQIGPFSKGLQAKNDIEKEEKRHAQPQQTKGRKVIKLPLSRLWGILKDLPLASDKLKFLLENIHFLPDSLSLGELNRILDLFARDSNKLEITKALLSRLNDNYREYEFERFKNHYARSSEKMKAINLLLRNEK